MNEIEFLPDGAEKKYNVKELLEGIKSEKERQKDLAQLSREDKNVPHPPFKEAPVTQGPEPERGWVKTLKIIGIILGVLASIATIIAVLIQVF